MALLDSISFRVASPPGGWGNEKSDHSGVIEGFNFLFIFQGKEVARFFNAPSRLDLTQFNQIAIQILRKQSRPSRSTFLNRIVVLL